MFMVSFGMRFQLQCFLVIVIRLLANENFQIASLLFYLGEGDHN